MTLGAARNVHHFIDEVHIGNVGGGNDTRIKDEMMELLTDSQQAGAAVGLGLGTVIALCYRLGTSVASAPLFLRRACDRTLDQPRDRDRRALHGLRHHRRPGAAPCARLALP
jgi:hypothetical protein